MALKNFDQIVERAKQSFRPQRVVIAGADSENILLGAFEAQDAGFATPILVGEPSKILPMLERLGLQDNLLLRLLEAARRLCAAWHIVRRDFPSARY